MHKQTLYYAKMKTPLGAHLWVVRSGRGVCQIEFGYSEPAFRAKLRRIWLEAILIHDAKALQKPLAELAQYFAGRRREFTFRQFMIGTGFQQLVWQAVSEIPFGRVATYKSIAQKIGKSPTVRAVGHANGSNPLPIVIPCQRVIGSNGDLCGYGGGIELKRKLLELEKKKQLLLRSPQFF
jgi:O-6-methylguanine DNA methyltransferase